MKKTATKQGTRRSLGISAFPIIILCFILAMVIYHFVYGNPANFINNDPNNHPIQGNLLGTIYKGGIIVPVIQTLLFTVLTLSVERLIALKRAKGKKNLQQFVTKVKSDLEEGNIEAVRQACDEQKGTVANVIKSSLSTYSQVSACDTLSKEEKQLAVRKDLEEATMLELPTNGTEPGGNSHDHYFRDFDGIARNCNRDDQVFRCIIFCRGNGFYCPFYRYFGGACEHGFRYCNRGVCCNCLQFFHQ